MNYKKIYLVCQFVLETRNVNFSTIIITLVTVFGSALVERSSARSSVWSAASWSCPGCAPQCPHDPARPLKDKYQIRAPATLARLKFHLPSMHTPKMAKSFSAFRLRPAASNLVVEKQKCRKMALSAQMRRNTSPPLRCSSGALILRRKFIWKRFHINLVLQMRKVVTNIFLPCFGIVAHGILQVLQRVRIRDGKLEVRNE